MAEAEPEMRGAGARPPGHVLGFGAAEGHPAQMVMCALQTQNLQLSKDMTLSSNRSLAEGNLLYQPQLDALKARLTQKYQQLQALFEAYQIKKTKLDRQSSSASLETLLALLQAEGAKIEEDTENMAERFLDGELPLDSFVDVYQSKRKLAHTRRVKIEKLQEMHHPVPGPGQDGALPLQGWQAPLVSPSTSPSTVACLRGVGPPVASPSLAAVQADIVSRSGVCSGVPRAGLPTSTLGRLVLLLALALL
ncbi:PREDICTED: vacuolar protein sorting-associated protein 37B [Elephantulus edwardii]|uniref:vacuolar protein sorting-associated protein 37B n=1 Tax=Elephantulus edwardii TaxID=28737 RepID=UPI0003F0A44E|nr:PREDICTED: vacuolar protein sorting-associated protein 37B [Elephantulus edwardii]